MSFLSSIFRWLFESKPKRNYRLEQWQEHIQQKNRTDAGCRK